MESNPALFVSVLTLLLLLQGGFLLFESGYIREKNTFNTAMKNFADIIIGLAAYLCAHSIIRHVYPELSYPMTSSALDRTLLIMPMDVIMGCYAVSCITISSGAIAERCRFGPYLALCAFAAGVIYPLIELACWGPMGFLMELGYLDRAGSGAVHLAGGSIALAATICLGPRRGRFLPDGTVHTFPMSNVVNVCFGCLLMIIGWFGFNVSSLDISTANVPESCMRIILSCIGGGLYGLLTCFDRRRKIYRVSYQMNGVLAGLVATTASFDSVPGTQAFVYGIIGGAVAHLAEKIVVRRRIDDAVGAVAVHAGGGVVGVIGAAFTPTGNLLAQFTAVICIPIVAFGLAYLFLKSIAKFTAGGIRPSSPSEEDGLNLAEHGAPSLADELCKTIANRSNAIEAETFARVEPYTNIGAIAAQYNELMEKLAMEFRSRLESIDQSSKGQIRVAALAHDLRNPVHALQGEAYVLESKLAANAEIPLSRMSKTAQIINEQCQQIEAMLKTVLAHSKSGFALRQGNDHAHWKQVFQHLVSIFDARLRADDVRLVLPNSLQLTDAAMIEIELVRVLANLISNSMRALRSQSSEENPTKRIVITVAQQGFNLVCFVQDNGPGIDEIVKHKLFEPFLTSSMDGHGVGLAACRDILQDFGGEIWLDSDRPARFGVRIPIYEPSNASSPPLSIPTPAGSVI
jgi:ammonia channel protein AmtB/nitrogen-specific signal transduction histidine kinase